MKKLLMLGAILTMGAMAYGEINETATANVKVRAEIVAENLIISDLNGKPIILDFDKVSQLQETGVSNANKAYKVTYVGGTEISDATLTMELKGQDVVGSVAGGAKEVTMKYQGSVAQGDKPDTFTSVVALDEYSAKMPTTNEYVGMINGTINHDTTKINRNGGQIFTGFDKTNQIANGEYIGTLELEVTLKQS